MAKKKTETLTCTRCGETMRMAEFYKVLHTCIEAIIVDYIFVKNV